MSFHYDNSEDNVGNPHKPPRRVRGGSQADDEMGNLWLQLLPVGAGDRRSVVLEALMAQRLERSAPGFVANHHPGALLLHREGGDDAVPYFDRAWIAAPHNEIAATRPGDALEACHKN